MEPKYYQQALGQQALQDISRGTPLRFEMIGGE